VGKSEGPKARPGVGFMGRGQQSPPYQLRGVGERCELLSGIQSSASTTQSFSTVFSTQDGLSLHYKWTIYLCTEVSGVENIGQCGRLSQLSWLLGAL